MRAIMCKSRSIFSACNSNFIDAEWKLQEAFFFFLWCLVEEIEEVRFSKCECDHCKSLEHDFEELIEEIVKEYTS